MGKLNFGKVYFWKHFRFIGPGLKVFIFILNLSNSFLSDLATVLSAALLAL